MKPVCLVIVTLYCWLIHPDDSSLLSDSMARGIPFDIHEEEGYSAAEVIIDCSCMLAVSSMITLNKVSGGLRRCWVSVVKRPSEALTLTIRKKMQRYEQFYVHWCATSTIGGCWRFLDRRRHHRSFQNHPLIHLNNILICYDILCERLPWICHSWTQVLAIRLKDWAHWKRRTFLTMTVVYDSLWTFEHDQNHRSTTSSTFIANVDD